MLLADSQIVAGVAAADVAAADLAAAGIVPPPCEGAQCWLGGGFVARLSATIDLAQSAPEGGGELDARIDGALHDRTFGAMADAVRYLWSQVGGSHMGSSHMGSSHMGSSHMGSSHMGSSHMGNRGVATPRACWSTDLTAGLALVPADFDVSMGHRDGICWAWMQPNDGWSPGAHEARHDHPLGSGLTVAYTIPLALVAAAMKLRVCWDRRRRVAAGAAARG